MKTFRTLLLLAAVTLLGPRAHAQQVLPPVGTTALVCAYNSSPPTITGGDFAYVQCDSSGKLIASGGGSGGVTSFNTRTGAVVPATGDYTIAQIGGLGANVATSLGDAMAAAGPLAAMGVANSCGTLTTSGNCFAITGTWNDNIAFPGALLVNMTNTSSAAGSLLADFQVGAVSQFSIGKLGQLNLKDINADGNTASIVGYFGTISFVSGPNPTSGSPLLASPSNNWFQVPSNGAFVWATSLTELTSPGAGQIQLGAADAATASVVPQILGPQNVAAGNLNGAGQNFVLRGSRGTGTGAGGNICFQTAAAGSSGTSQNALANALCVLPNGLAQAGANGFTANGTTSLSLTALGPSGAHATVQEWLTVEDSSGNTRYIPAF